MRYYHPFPEAIPLSEAGCSRVTHPSATSSRSKLLSPVRLACVRRAASVRPEPGSNSLVVVYSPFGQYRLIRSDQTLTFFVIVNPKLILFLEFQGSLIRSCLLFNFQGASYSPRSRFALALEYRISSPRFARFVNALSFDSFNILSHLHPFVNTFFEIFSKNF